MGRKRSTTRNCGENFKVAAREVKYVISDGRERKALLEQSMPEWLVRRMLDLQQYISTRKAGKRTSCCESFWGGRRSRWMSF